MLSNISIGQYFPSDSWVHKLDPRTKILITMVFCHCYFHGQVLSFLLFGYSLCGLVYYPI